MTMILRQHWAKASFSLFSLAVIAVSYLGSSVAGGWFLETTRQAGFVLSNLTVEGIDRTKEHDILATLDVDDGIPLLGIDLASIQARIETLPWVKTATVTRILPGDLHVNVVEREPFALWQHAGKVRLIDESGAVITGRGLVEFSDLMLVVGEKVPSDITSLFQMLEEKPALATRIKTAVRVGERRWDLVFNNGVRVKLPEDMSVDYDSNGAWKRFARLEKAHKLLEREVSVIDMRIKDRIVMRVTPAGRRLMDGKESAT